MKTHQAVVDEHSGFERVTASVALALAVSICLPAPRAQAGPEGAQVAHGQVSIQQNGDVTTIQASHNSVIRYESFDIQRQETVQFVQPNEAARVLNRVLGVDPTRIDGALLANGQVYILNPQGVFFGGTAVVDVHQLVAGAGSMSDADFLSGIDHITDIRGEVANFGAIHADVVKLIGRQVANHGSIVAPGGVVMLVAGSDVYLAKPGERLVVKLAGVDAAKARDGAGVTNAGTVDAGDGGVVFAAGDLYSIAVQHSGTTRARDIAIEGGAGGLVSVSGTLDACDATPGGTGGTVQVTGDRIAVTGARIDASGDAGGGTVLVGGDDRGHGETPHVSQTDVGSDAAIHADAGTHGDGGRVVVWADGSTRVDGAITARGGAQGGDGGRVETSGASLRVTQAPDAGAPNGAPGTWLLDPANVNIVDAYTTAARSEILDTTIEVALEGGTSVTVDTNVDLNEPGNITQAASATIDVDDPTIGAGVTLTLDAANDITLNGGVLATGGRAVSVTLRANDPAQVAHDLDPAAGSVAINAPVRTHGGNVTVTAGKSVTSNAGADVTTTARDDTGRASGRIAITAGTTVLLGGGLVSEGAANANGNGSDGGNVDVTAKNGRLAVSAIMTFGGQSTPANGGGGGAITLTRDDGAGGGAGALVVAGPLGSEAGASAPGATPAAGGAVRLDSVNNVAVNGLTRLGSGAFSSKGVRFTNAAAIRADTISIEHSGDVHVNANLTAALASPAQPSLSVRSGNDGTGDLKLGPAVTLSAESTRLRAGSGSGTTAFVDLGGAELTGTSGAATNPRVFEQRQDRAILGADSAAVDRFGANQVDGLAYTLRSDGGDVTLDAAKVKGSALTVAAKTGSLVNVDAPLGLASLTAGVDDAADGLGAVKLDSAAATPSITTAQGQRYVAPLHLAQDWLLQSTASAPIAFERTVDGPGGLTVTTAGLTSFEDGVGALARLASLRTDGGGTTAIHGGSVTTTNGQSYGDGPYTEAVTLGVGVQTLTSTAGAPIMFRGPVDGAGGLLVTTAGGTSFRDAVGGTTPLAGLTTNGGGATAVNGAGVKTVAHQTYDGAVTVDDDPKTKTFESTNGGAIAFDRTLDGPGDVTVTTGGPTSFQGVVGAIMPLASLTTNGGGTTAVNGAGVKTVAHQTYEDAVTVDDDPKPKTFESTDGGAIAFDRTLDGPAEVTVTTGGVTSFRGAVGGITPLASLETDGGNATAVNGAGVQVVGDQTYDDALIVGDDPTTPEVEEHTLESTDSGAIAFNDTVDGPGGLVVTTGGLTTFAQTVGGDTALESLTTNGGGGMAIRGEGVTTSKDQSYADAVRLGPDAMVFESTQGGTIAFDSTVDGPADAMVTTGGVTSFQGAVGGTTPLAGLETNGGGTTAILGGAVTTNGTQRYGDTTVSESVTLGTGLQSLRANRAPVTFTGPVDGPGGLEVEALASTVTFQGDVGGSVPVDSLTVNVGSDPEYGRIDFQAPDVTSENDIALNPGGRSSVPTVATMFRAAGDLTLESTNGNVVFGPREKLGVSGDLQIVARQAVLSDLVAGRSLTVDANQIAVLLREPASVRLPDGTLLQKDRGTDFVASFIDFSETPNGVAIPGVVADDSDMTFGTPTGNDVSSELAGNQTVRRKLFDPERPLSPADLVLDENGVQSRLDVAPTGLFVSVFNNPNVAGAIIDPRQLGQRPRVTARPIRAIDILAFLACAPDESGQVPKGCEDVARFEEPVIFEAGSVTGPVSAAPVSTTAAAPPPLDERLHSPEAKHAGALYQALYRTESIDVEQGKVGVVELSAVDQSARMREEIQGAVDAYRTKTGAATVDPAEFARFVESDPSQAGALDTMRKLGELFTSYKAMGLTPIEYRGVTREQIRELTPEGLSVEELVEAIETAWDGTGRSAGRGFLRRFSRIAAAGSP